VAVIGGSEAIRRVNNELQLEDVVNDKEEAYVNLHNTEIQNHGGSTLHQEEQQAQSSGEAPN